MAVHKPALRHCQYRTELGKNFIVNQESNGFIHLFSMQYSI
ncbi:MAG: hypothetical protein PHW96_04765 [Candidatus Nanoarchaeia archaeon]|nr:hypothetical protein [Candidatus Nanoarchaeia archaeon]